MTKIKFSQRPFRLKSNHHTQDLVMYSSIGKLQPSIEYTHSFIIFSFLEHAYACGGTSEPQAITILMLVQINFSTCTLAQVYFILWIS